MRNVNNNNMLELLSIEDVGIEPQKARHDVTKLDLTIPLLFF